MINRQNTDFFTALLLLLFSVFLLISIPHSIDIRGEPRGLGPMFYPKLLSYTLIFLCSVQVIKIFINLKKGSRNTDSPEHGSWEKVIFIFITLVIYISTVEFLTFIIGSILFMSIIMWSLDARKWSQYASLILTILIISYIFEGVMSVVLP